MVRPRRWAALALGAGCVAGSAACANLLGFGSLEEDSPGDAAVAAAEASGNPTPPLVSPLDAGGPPACEHARWPGPPDADIDTSDAGADAGDLVLAMESFDFGLNPSDTRGYDLDNVCTTSIEAGSCTLSRLPNAPYPIDRSHGVDKGASSLLLLLEALNTPLQPSGAQSFVDLGIFGLVLHIVRYNGLPDDAELTVNVFTSSGTPTHVSDGGKPVHDLPKRDGTDAWELDPNGFLSTRGGVSVVFDAKAYVASSVLVAKFDRFVLSVPTSGGITAIVLQQAILTGQLKRVPKGYRLDDVVLAGRWATQDLFETFRHERTAADDPQGYLCFDANKYAQLKKLVCAARDIRADSDDPQLACNAMSLQVFLTMGPALFAGPSDAGVPDAPADPCAPSGVPDADNCP